MLSNYIYLVASVYGEGVYGEGLYGLSIDSDTGGGGLADTGFAIIALITLACFIIFVALLMRHLNKRRGKKYSARKGR